MDWEDPDWEQPIYFDPDGECRCLHDSSDHGWGGCEREGCPCTAHWEE